LRGAPARGDRLLRYVGAGKGGWGRARAVESRAMERKVRSRPFSLRAGRGLSENCASSQKTKKLSFAACVSSLVARARSSFPSERKMPLLHIVALNFKADYTEEQIVEHFRKEVNLKERMPELVKEWSFKKNTSLDSRRDVNGGCQWVVLCTLYDPEKLSEYLTHPEHKEVGRYQNPMLEGRFVVDVVVDEDGK
jgi:hypothetical protein